MIGILSLVLGCVGGFAFTVLFAQLLGSGEGASCQEKGVELRPGLRANCLEARSSGGSSIVTSTNEDGIRDAPRKRILSNPNRVLLLGDSLVAGEGLDENLSLSASLRDRFGGTYFVNAGFPRSGPIFQAEVLPGLLRTYRPKLVVWMLTETDAVDDRFACSLRHGENGMKAQKSGASTWMAKGPLVGAYRNWLREREWARAIRSEGSRTCGACQGVRDVARAAREAGVPLRSVYFAPAGHVLAGYYAGESSPRATMESCLREAGIPFELVDFSAFPADRREAYYGGDDVLPAADGIAALTDQMVPSLKVWLAEKQ